jgi:cytochrome c oxidase subunit 3
VLRAIPLPAAMAGSLLLLALGALAFMRLPLAANGTRGVAALLLLSLGVAAVLSALTTWVFRTIWAADRATGATQSPRVAMFAFIASEIVFFAAFFWVYLYYAIDPEIAGMTAWPPAAARPPAAWGGPLINTAILLSSGVAVAGAYDLLLRGSDRTAQLCLMGAIGLGLIFLALQGREYWLSPLHYQDGIYPSLFYIATGFHGLHVVIGLVMIGVCVVRLRGGKFDPQRHFGFEAAVWYWHFVDAVWLILFAVFYVWVV